MTLVREDSCHDQYYDYIHRLLTILGLWPTLKRSRRLSCVTVVFILLFIGISGQIYFFLISERKVEPTIEILQTFLPTFIYASAYWNLLYNSEKMKEILERVKSDWNKLTCEDDLKIMHIYAAQSKIFSKSMACTFWMYSVFLTLPSIIRFFLYVFSMIDKTKLILPVHNDILLANKCLYYLAFSYQLTTILLTSTIGITYYSLLLSFLQHACALFIVVTNKIEQPFIKVENKFTWTKATTMNDIEFQWVTGVAETYNNAINFVGLITSLYASRYIIELLMVFIVIIIDFIYLFQLLKFMITVREALKLCLYIGGSLVMIYAYFYLGERLMEHSTTVYSKLLLVPFYTLSNNTNKLLLLLIIRSMKPCILSYRGTAVVSHQLFAKIMKLSFSIATVLYNVR